MARGTSDKPTPSPGGARSAATSEGGSAALRATLQAELRRRRHLRAALAALVPRPQVGAALRAELPALGLRLALRAARDHLAVEVQPLRLVPLAHLRVDLLHLGLRLRGRDLLLGLRRAVRAQPALLVPADRVADPLAAADALREVRLDLRHRRLQRGVVGLAAHRALDLVGAVGGGDKAEADVEAEHAIRSCLLEAFPDWGYRGEETGAHAGAAGQPTWLVDPNDGTRDYLAGRRGSAVSIGLVRDGRPVLGVVFA